MEKKSEWIETREKCGEIKTFFLFTATKVAPQGTWYDGMKYFLFLYFPFSSSFPAQVLKDDYTHTWSRMLLGMKQILGCFPSFYSCW